MKTIKMIVLGVLLCCSYLINAQCPSGQMTIEQVSNTQFEKCYNAKIVTDVPSSHIRISGGNVSDTCWNTGICETRICYSKSALFQYPRISCSYDFSSTVPDGCDQTRTDGCVVTIEPRCGGNTGVECQ